MTGWLLAGWIIERVDGLRDVKLTKRHLRQILLAIRVLEYLGSLRSLDHHDISSYNKLANLSTIALIIPYTIYMVNFVTILNLCKS
jgi:hypothetical protein